MIMTMFQFYHLLKDEDNSRSPCLPAKQLQHAGSLDTSTDSDCSPVIYLFYTNQRSLDLEPPMGYDICGQATVELCVIKSSYIQNSPR